MAHDQYSHELWSAQEFDSRDDGDAPRPGDRVSSGRGRRAGSAPLRHGGGLRAGARLHGALRPPGGGRRRAAAARGGAPQVPSPGPHLSAMGRRAAGGAPDPLRPREESRPDAGPRARALHEPGDDRDGSREPSGSEREPAPGDRHRDRPADHARPRRRAPRRGSGGAHGARRRGGAGSRRARARAGGDRAEGAREGILLLPADAARLGGVRAAREGRHVRRGRPDGRRLRIRRGAAKSAAPAHGLRPGQPRVRIPPLARGQIGGTEMPLKKILVGVTLVAFLGSDFAFGIAPALGQSPGAGNGQVPMPSLGGNSDGFGRVLPGPSTTAPYQNAPQPQREPQTPYPTQRPVAPSSANICQPGGGGRAYQTVAVPRTRALETLVPGPQQPATTVTQVTVTQNAPAQVPQSPSPGIGQTQRLATVAEVQVPEVEELSRIEAAFTLDRVRQLAVPMGLYQPAGGQQPGAQQPAALQQPGIQQIGLQQQAGGQSGNQQPGGQPQQLLVQPFGAQGQAMLGPFGTPLRQYGYSIFAANVSTFAPVDDIPVGPDYVMGPGDDVTINVWGAVDSTLVRTVDRNGRIVLPKVGDLRIWGLTFAQADRLIRDELARYFRGFQTSVTMGRLRTVNVYVVGEVCQPGVFTLSALSTATNALFSAGGPTKLGSLREVRLIRGGHQVAKLDLYDFLQRGDRTRDYRLESGDTIFVPPIGDVVAVAGEVKRPAIYEIRTDTRLADVVTMAGGVTPTSYLRRVQVVRALPSSERVTVDVDLTGYYLKGDEKNNPPVTGGDLVLIHRSDPRIYNTVRVEGAVKYPGVYELKPMMRISDLLPAETLLPEAQPERVAMERRRADLSVELLSANPQKAGSGDADQDVRLKPLDEVTVRTQLKPARTVTLTGQIVRPGVYTIAEGEPLSSVLERAGGYTDRAFIKGAVFTRAALRKAEGEQLDAFLKSQEQRMLAAASTVIVGAEKDEVAGQQQALHAPRQLLRALASKVVVGRMVVHLDAPDKLKSTGNDVILADGDTLNVPEPPQSVLVIGAVRNSTSVQYKKSANVDYYVNRVGGVSKEADKKEVHRVKADGSAVSSLSDIPALEAGESIIVPPQADGKIRAVPTIRDAGAAPRSAPLGPAAPVGT